MRKITIIIICVMLSTSVINITAIGLKQSNSTDSISKSKDRDMLYVNGDGSAEYTKIQDAINAAHDSDTIFVFSGIYYENININKNYLTLIGEDKNTTIIDANGTGVGLFILNKVYNYISSFTIRDASSSGVNICASGDNVICNNNIISDCIITNNNDKGILINAGSGHGWSYAYATYTSIINCEISNNGNYGILTDTGNNADCSYTQIKNSCIYNNSNCGVQLTAYSYDLVSNCTVYNNGAGGGINIANYDRVSNCTVYNNTGNGILAYSEDTISHCQSYNNTGGGIYSTNSVSLSDCIAYDNLGNGIYADGSHQKIRNIITYNNAGNGCTVQSVPSFTLTNSTAYNNHHGFLVDTSPNGIVSNCTAYNNTWQGILLDSSSNIQVENCTSHDNYNGIGIIDNSHSNRITTCRIINNSFYGVYCILSNDNDLFLNDINNTNNVYLFNSHNNWNSTDPIAYTYNGSNYFQRLGNHWNDYTGVDSNHDGIGDTPYVIGSDTDDYPLIESFEIYSELPNQPPTASFYYQPANPTIADTVQFHSTSVDPDGQIVSWYWSFGDGTYASTEHPSHQYTTSGWYTVNLTVHDNDNSIDSYDEQLYIATPFLSWSSILTMQETGGKTDTIVFGEKLDASDGQDVYDIPKNPLGIPPCVYTYFETNLTSPYNKLWYDIKNYPAVYKQWNFSVQWNPSDNSSTTITLSWNPSSFVGSEYTKVHLQNLANGTKIDMRTTNSYSIAVSAFTPYHFRIICVKNAMITTLAAGWNFVSLPFNTSVQKTNLLIRYNNNEYNWSNASTSGIVLDFIYTWNRTAQTYQIANTLVPGYGYWVYAYYSSALWAQRVNGEGADGTITSLHSLWNLIGLPENITMPKEQLRVLYNGADYSWSQATTSNNPTGGPIILGFVYGWDRSTQQYTSSTTVNAGYAYWMYAYYNCTLLYQTTLMMNTGDDFGSTPSRITKYDRAIQWVAILTFTNPTGQNDYVKFGEAPDATDGPPADSYDTPRTPPPMAPYIYSWFNDNLPSPYTQLWEDYRFYPENTKLWNLSVQWVPTDYVTPTTITISWNPTIIDTSEYTSVKLCTTTGTPLKNMLVDSSYSFTCPAMIPQNFKIICSINQPPIANPDTYTTNEDTTLTVTAPGLLANDNDPDNDPLTAIKITNPSHGSVTLNANGGLTYVPVQNYNGPDSFIYRANDGLVNSSNATVSITVLPVNDAPIVTDIPDQTIAEGSSFTTITLDNYVSDVDNTDEQMTWTYSGNIKLKVSIVNRIATISAPNADWYGSETITFKATDPGSLWDDDAATFTITPVNDPPRFGTPTPGNGSIGHPVSFVWEIPFYDIEGNPISWTIQCSNGQTNSGTNAGNGTQSLTLSGLLYSTVYRVWVNATDPTGSGQYTRAWYSFTTQQQQNVPPNKPDQPSGETNGNINTEYTYSTKTMDTNGDQIYYNWSWGDGSYSGWLGPYSSDVTASGSHTWTKKGSYTIRVKAKDPSGLESDWSDPLAISMPFDVYEIMQSSIRVISPRPMLMR